jgi:cyclopropane fatty-acyl-phospholipid synthase-like methyltransferase
MSDEPVISFYNSHPMSEWQILRSLEKRGKPLSGLTPEDLFDFDQDHYGGVQAVELLAERAKIDAASVVVDLCSGLGGSARFLASRYGCRVTGVDITGSRVESAQRLTSSVGLADRVQFLEADATSVPLPDGGSTACISQEAFVHIEDKAALLAECFRLLRAGGVLAFTDWAATERLSEGEQQRLRSDFAADGLVTANDYRQALERAGFSNVSHEDLSPDWAQILRERLAMYRSLREETVARFGEDHYKRYDHSYAFFVHLVETGKLGGARLTALHP